VGVRMNGRSASPQLHDIEADQQSLRASIETAKRMAEESDKLLKGKQANVNYSASVPPA
jgi:hypothetical protein